MYNSKFIGAFEAGCNVYSIGYLAEMIGHHTDIDVIRGLQMALNYRLGL